MNKNFRQGQILKLIQGKRILTQEDLARELKERHGIQTTQVTLSRDIRDLGLLKTQDGYRAVTSSAGRSNLASVAAELLRDVRVAQNLIVLRTSPGNANAIAVALDDEAWPEIVGTIAGDDTILVIAPDSDIAQKLQSKFLGYVQTE